MPDIDILILLLVVVKGSVIFNLATNATDDSNTKITKHSNYSILFLVSVVSDDIDQTTFLFCFSMSTNDRFLIRNPGQGCRMVWISRLIVHIERQTLSELTPSFLYINQQGNDNWLNNKTMFNDAFVNFNQYARECLIFYDSNLNGEYEVCTCVE